MPVRTPLRYRITSLRQLPECKSNTSSELKITVSDFIQNTDLSGMRITLKHMKYGDLFTYVVNASGSLIVADTSALTPQQIIDELSRYGFIIQYDSAEKDMSSDQVEYLMTLQKLGYDKIRYLNVTTPGCNAFSTSKSTTYVVVFKISSHPNWLDNKYSAKESEYLQALVDGSVINIGTISQSKQYDWSWIGDSVLSIEDVISQIARA